MEPEERPEGERRRAVRWKAELATLTTRERTLFCAYYAFSIPAMPIGLLLTLVGHGTMRTVGLVLLVLAVLLMAFPVGPVLGGRIRRRKRASLRQP